MKKLFVTLLFTTTLLCGCVDMDPAISKDTMGNLEVSVAAPPGVDVHPARIYVDGVFVGNVSDRLPVLYIKRGLRTVKVELDGMKTYEQAITILGDPNHQFLNVAMTPK